MSINSLTNAAVARRPDFAPLNALPSNLSEIAAAAAGMPAADTGSAAPPANGMTSTNGINTAMQVLFGYIPTEVLTLYVAVVAALHPTPAAAQTEVVHQGVVANADWYIYFIFLAATPVIFWVVYATKLKSAQKPLPIAVSTWPIWEMFAATVAYSAWAFALPNTPFNSFGWYSTGLAGVVVLVASTVLGLLAPLFQNKLGTGA